MVNSFLGNRWQVPPQLEDRVVTTELADQVRKGERINGTLKVKPRVQAKPPTPEQDFSTMVAALRKKA